MIDGSSALFDRSVSTATDRLRIIAPSCQGRRDPASIRLARDQRAPDAGGSTRTNLTREGTAMHPQESLILPLACGLFLLGAAFATGADAAVGEENKITCMYPVWVGFGPVHLANELGYFKDEGIDGRGDPRRRHAERHGGHGARRHRLLPAHGRRVSGPRPPQGHAGHHHRHDRPFAPAATAGRPTSRSSRSAT